MVQFIDAPCFPMLIEFCAPVLQTTQYLIDFMHKTDGPQLVNLFADAIRNKYNICKFLANR